MNNIRRTAFPVQINGISKEPLIVNEIADSPLFGTVYYHPEATANIISLAALEKDFSVNQVKDNRDRTAGFIATNRKSKEEFSFQKRSNLFVYYAVRIPREAKSYVNTVKFRKRKYSKREIQRADLAHLIKERMGWPSNDMLKRIINSGCMLNMPITSADVDRDLDIYGQSWGEAAGKFVYHPTSNKDDQEHVSDEAGKLISDMKSKPLNLYCDIIFVEKLAFFVSVSRPLDYVIITLIESRTWECLLQAIEAHKNTYMKYGWTCHTIHFDREKGVRKIRGILASQMELYLNNSAPYKHVPIVERKIRVIKERMRAQLAHLGYRINRNFLAYLPKYIARRLNVCPSNHNGLSVSPYEILTGLRVDYKVELRIGYGELAYVWNRNSSKPINSVTQERAKLCICLGISNNKDASAIFFDLSKGMKQTPIISDDFKPQPMNTEVIMRLNDIAEGQGVTPQRTDAEHSDSDDDQMELEERQDNVANEDFAIDNNDDTPIEQYTHTSKDAEDILPVTDSSKLADNFDDSLHGDVTEPSEVIPLRGDDHAHLTHEANDDDEEVANEVESAETEHPSSSPEAEMTANESQPEKRYGTRSRSGISKSKAYTSTAKYVRIDGIEGLSYHISMAQGIKRHKDLAYSSINCELQAMENKKVFHPLNFHQLSYQQRKSAIRSFIFLKEKFKPNGDFDKLKSRLTASGNQQDRVHIENTFGSVSSPTISMSSLMTILAISKSEKRHMATMDIGCAFLNADMSDENVIIILDKVTTQEYLKIRPDVQNLINERGELYLKLNKALYGSIQASKLWWEEISGFLKSLGFKPNPYDQCVFNKRVGMHDITIGVYVDDLLITSTNRKLINEFKSAIDAKYKDTNYEDNQQKLNYLGMLLNNSNPEYLSISMPKYIDDLIIESGIDTTHTAATPASEHLFKVIEDDTPLDHDDKEKFHSIVAKLLYLAKRGRPDVLTVATMLCTRVQNPGQNDLKKLNRCIKYINSTRDKDLRIRSVPKTSLHVMRAYVDASFAIHVPALRSHSGCVISIGRHAVIHFESIKQKLNAKSSTEAEIIGVSDVLPQIIACKRFLESQLQRKVILKLYQDNMSTIDMFRNGRPDAKQTRHIDIRFFFVSDYENRDELMIKYLPTELMHADYYTKPLHGKAFDFHASFIMGRSC